MNRDNFHCQQCGMCCSILLPFCHALVKVPDTNRYECLHHGTGKKPEACVNYPFNPDGTVRVDQEKICPEVRRLIKHEELVAVLIAWFGEFKKVVRMTTGEAYKVPTRDIIEKGIREQDLDQYPKWEEGG